MKRSFAVLLLLCLLGISLFGCGKETYSYKEITGCDVSETLRIETNGGYLQSWRASILCKKANLLDVDYKPTDKDIYRMTVGYDEKDELPEWYGGMLYIYTENEQLDFVIDKEGLVYVYSPILRQAFVSVTPIDESFFADKMVDNV